MAIGSGSSGVNKVTSFCLPSFLMIFSSCCASTKRVYTNTILGFLRASTARLTT